MKTVILVTYYWPPMGGGGVHRWLKMSKYLHEFGIKLVVVTVEGGEVSTVDNSLLAQLPEGIELIRVPIWEPFAFYRRLIGSKQKIQPGLLKENNDSSGFKEKLALFIRANFFIPDAKMFWKMPAFKAIKAYLKDKKADAIISTGPPHTTHLIGKKVKNDLGLKWIADFRDPWTDIDFYEKLPITAPADWIHKSMEKSVFKTADELVTVTWSWAAKIEETRKREVKVITNGFDKADFGDQNIALDQEFSILHTGSMNGDRNPNAFWEAVAMIKDDSPEIFNELRIKQIGPADYSAKQKVKELGIEEKVSFIPSMDHNEVVRQQQSAKVLLLAINSSKNVSGIIPGKLYEYLGAARPIIAIGDLKGDAVKVLNETGMTFNFDFTDAQGIKNALVKIYGEKDHGAFAPNSEICEKYTRRNLAKAYAELI